MANSNHDDLGLIVTYALSLRDQINRGEKPSPTHLSRIINLAVNIEREHDDQWQALAAECGPYGPFDRRPNLSCTD